MIGATTVDGNTKTGSVCNGIGYNKVMVGFFIEKDSTSIYFLIYGSFYTSFRMQYDVTPDCYRISIVSIAVNASLIIEM